MRSPRHVSSHSGSRGCFSARAGVGRDVSRWPHQRHSPAAHQLPPEPPLSALLRPDARSVPWQVVVVDGRRRQAGVAHTARAAHQLAQSRKTLTGVHAAHRLAREKNVPLSVVSRKSCQTLNKVVWQHVWGMAVSSVMEILKIYYRILRWTCEGILKISQQFPHKAE